MQRESGGIEGRQHPVGISTNGVTRGFGYLEPFLSRQRAATADRLIPRGHRSGRILDVGCGNRPHFLLHTDFQERYGVDKLVDPQRSRESHANGIQLVHYDIESGEPLPFDAGTFDVVTMLAVVEHIDPERVIPLFREVRRTLRNGGIFVLTTPARRAELPLWIMARLRLVSPDEVDEHKTAYNNADLLSRLRAAEFSSDRVRAGYFQLWMNNWAIASR